MMKRSCPRRPHLPTMTVVYFSEADEVRHSVTPRHPYRKVDTMSTTNERARGTQQRDNGHSDFTVTYDDTGAEVTISAPNGWTIRRVIEEAYRELGEEPRPEDRVEMGGQSIAPYLDLHVKEFIERGLPPHFSIASNIGGATR